MSLERRIAFEVYWRGASGTFHGANYAPHNSKITGLRTDGLVLSKANAVFCGDLDQALDHCNRLS